MVRAGVSYALGRGFDSLLRHQKRNPNGRASARLGKSPPKPEPRFGRSGFSFFGVFALLSAATVLACGQEPHSPPPSTRGPARGATNATERFAIEVRVHVDGVCVKGVRALTVAIDDHTERLEAPCQGAVVSAPGPSYDARPVEVPPGPHTVEVRDEDTGNHDRKTFDVPHVERMGDGMVAGQHVEVWVSPESVSVRAPTALRVPTL